MQLKRLPAQKKDPREISAGPPFTRGRNDLLFHYLSTQFAARVCRRINVEVPTTGLKVCRLGVCQGCIPFDQACEIALQRDHWRSIGVCRGWPVEVSRRGGTGQAGVR